MKNLIELAKWIARTLAVSCIALTLGAGFTGCFGFLKPAHETTQRFVLTPVPSDGSVTVPPGALALGVGQVRLPGYLLDTSLAVRHATNRIDYLPMVLWAERLETGIQRILAANLAILLPTDRIRLSSWRADDVAVEVHLTIEQFDVDSSGRGVFIAWWRVLSPGGEKTLKSGETRLTLQGPVAAADPAGAVNTLSTLLADASRQIAQAIKENAPR